MRKMSAGPYVYSGPMAELRVHYARGRVKSGTLFQEDRAQGSCEEQGAKALTDKNDLSR